MQEFAAEASVELARTKEEKVRLREVEDQQLQELVTLKIQLSDVIKAKEVRQLSLSMGVQQLVSLMFGLW